MQVKNERFGRFCEKHDRFTAKTTSQARKKCLLNHPKRLAKNKRNPFVPMHLSACLMANIDPNGTAEIKSTKSFTLATDPF